MPTGITVYGAANGTKNYYVQPGNGKPYTGAVKNDGSNWTNDATLLTSGEIAQDSGTSTTKVMSQNAVTSMVFADPSTMNNIKIGRNAGATGYYSIGLGYQANAQGNNNVAIGRNANVSSTATNAVALGEYSLATVKGQFDISALGNVASTEGYNNSAYRLLTGLYDGQSAHDAATVGQITPTTDSSAPTTSTAGRLGEIRIDTTDNSAYMCVVSDSTTPAYEWKKITA